MRQGLIPASSLHFILWLDSSIARLPGARALEQRRQPRSEMARPSLLTGYSALNKVNALFAKTSSAMQSVTGGSNVLPKVRIIVQDAMVENGIERYPPARASD